MRMSASLGHLIARYLSASESSHRSPAYGDRRLADAEGSRALHPRGRAKKDGGRSNAFARAGGQKLNQVSTISGDLVSNCA